MAFTSVNIIAWKTCYLTLLSFCFTKPLNISQNHITNKTSTEQLGRAKLILLSVGSEDGELYLLTLRLPIGEHAVQDSISPGQKSCLPFLTQKLKRLIRDCGQSPDWHEIVVDNSHREQHLAGDGDKPERYRHSWPEICHFWSLCDGFRDLALLIS